MKIICRRFARLDTAENRTRVSDGLTLQRVLAGRREVQRVNLFTESIIIVAIALPVTVNILMFPRAVASVGSGRARWGVHSAPPKPCDSNAQHW